MSKTLKISLVVLIVLALSYIFASPYLTLYQIREAVKNEDSTAVASYVDFPRVQQSLKDQFNAHMLKRLPQTEQREDGLAALGAMFASTMVDKMVDMTVTPQGLTLLLQGKKLSQDMASSFEMKSQQAESTSSQKRDEGEKVQYRGYYQSINQFAVEIKRPEQASAMTVILQRQGLGWKITQILLANEM